MSSVLRPSGPLPSRVYWVRRLIVIVVLALAVGLLWWLAGRLGNTGSTGNPADLRAEDSGGQLVTDGAPTGSGNDGSPTTDGNATGTNSDDDPSDGGGATTRSGEKRHDRSHKPGSTRRHHPHRPPLPEPSGDCDPAEVAVDLSADDVESGHPDSMTLSLTSRSVPACTLAITPDLLVLRITSGSDVIWSSDDCPDLVLARKVVVRQQPATKYDFTWDGHRSVDGCTGPGQVAKPGGYWIETAFIGGGIERAYFDVT